MHALSCIAGIHALEVTDFLAQAGEEFLNIWHLFNHTLCRAGVPVTKSIPKIWPLAYCTVNNFALVAVPPVFVTEIFPELAPAGTVTRIKFAVSTLKVAAVPLIATAVVPTKCDPCTTNVAPALPLVGRKLMTSPRVAQAPHR